MPQFLKLTLYNETNLSIRFQDYNLVTFGNILDSSYKLWLNKPDYIKKPSLVKTK